MSEVETMDVTCIGDQWRTEVITKDALTPEELHALKTVAWPIVEPVRGTTTAGDLDEIVKPGI